MSAIDIRHALYSDRARDHKGAVLQYHRGTDRLRTWPWPSSVQSRIHPGALHEYRVKHQMLGPCCLCPLKDANGPDFKEAAIYMTNSGLFSGEYIASCATGDCGYLVPLERMYTQFGLVIKNYPLRAPGEQVPPSVWQRSENDASQPQLIVPRPLKRTYAMLDINAAIIPSRQAPKRAKDNLLERLDARTRSGITSAEFRRLFVSCECGMFTTRRAFKDHQCIVDLTVDE